MTGYLMTVAAVVLFACSLLAADVPAAADEWSADRTRQAAAESEMTANPCLKRLEDEFNTIISNVHEDAVRRGGDENAGGHEEEPTERMRFEDAKKTAADEGAKTKFLAKLDRVIAGMERLLKMSLEDTQKIRADFEKKIEEMSKKFVRAEQPWIGTKICGELLFSVEYRRAHPFLAEYDRRIRFKSGKSVCVDADTGGAGDFASYALEDGKIYLIDGLDRVWIRSEYRIDACAESVEKKCEDVWIRIPDDSLGVTWWSYSALTVTVDTDSGSREATEGVSVGDSMKGERYLGRITPSGKFTAGGAEPEIQRDEVTWTSGKITEEVPFAYERGESKTHRCFARISFRSGKKVAIGGLISNEHFGIYRLSDGRFLLALKEGTLWEEMYCIDLGEESVSIIYKGWLVRIPDDAISIADRGAGANGVSVDVVTPNGRSKISGTDTVTDLFIGAHYIGMIASDGTMTELRDGGRSPISQRRRTRMVRSAMRGRRVSTPFAESCSRPIMKNLNGKFRVCRGGSFHGRVGQATGRIEYFVPMANLAWRAFRLRVKASPGRWIRTDAAGIRRRWKPQSQESRTKN